MDVTVAQRDARRKGFREIVGLESSCGVFHGGGDVLLARLLHVVMEDLKGSEHLVIGVMCIAAARIRQEKYPRPGELPGGHSKIEWAFRMFLG